ncbi:MAG: hypothetical protein NZM31_03160, partial [Gemmatales bacterium]|nr:hypothetical protein [Gemmatales bacterium]MDW8385999.1 hypothetical protein [Gemmatales bacterium]
CLERRPYQSATPAAPTPYVKPATASGPASPIQQASGRFVAPQQARVEAVAARILEKNRQLGLNPRFEVVPGSERKMLRQGDRIVQLSEGLVDACVRDEQLAALLALELGRMASQRQAERPGDDERLPPMEVPIGGPDGGGFGPQLRQAEMAKLGLDRRRPASNPVANAEDIARQVLTRAGYPPTEVEPAKTLLAQ